MLNRILPWKREETIDPRLLAYPQELNGKIVTYPTLNQRLSAACGDGFLLNIISYPTILLAQYLFGYMNIPKEEISIENLITNIAIQMITTILVSIISLSLFAYKFGTTPGKWCFGLYIVDADTYQKPSLAKIFMRHSGYIITALLLFIPLLIFSRFDLRKRALHDKLSGTLVIRLRKPKQKKNQ